ncbi:MAG TPA: YbaB/EbfC family nucleoid-associated protein [Rhodothermales bacterium]|nr:YbaB/EbfC family nucleoid-associated protein [Rhodothermales bacterium]
MASPFDISGMMGQIAEMQRKMQEAQQALAQQTVTAEVGGGMVKVTANGQQRVTAITIDRAALGDDAEMLEDLIIAGVNKALDEASALARQAAEQSLGGMLPPGFDMSQLGV